MSRLLTPVQVSEILGVTEGTLAVWRTTGRYDLTFTKIGGKVFYDYSDIENWIVSRKRTNTG